MPEFKEDYNGRTVIHRYCCDHEYRGHINKVKKLVVENDYRDKGEPNCVKCSRILTDGELKGSCVVLDFTKGSYSGKFCKVCRAEGKAHPLLVSV